MVREDVSKGQPSSLRVRFVFDGGEEGLRGDIPRDAPIAGKSVDIQIGGSFGSIEKMVVADRLSSVSEIA